MSDLLGGHGKSPQPEGDDIWASAADLMSGLLLVFILVVVVTIFRVRAAETTTESLQGENQRLSLALSEYESLLGSGSSAGLDQAIEELRTALAENPQLHARIAAAEERLAALAAVEEELLECRADLATMQSRQSAWQTRDQAIIDVERRVGELASQLGIETGGGPRGVLPIPSDLLFAYNSDELQPDGIAFLNTLVPQLAERLLSDELTRSLVHRIVIEGHSSGAGPETANMHLSARRAVAVYRHVLRETGTFPHRAEFLRRLAPTGRGEIEARDPDEDDQGDRRVDIRVEFHSRPEDPAVSGGRAPAAVPAGRR